MKRAVALLWLVALCDLMMFAQAGRSPRVGDTTEMSPPNMPPGGVPAGLRIIYGNLGPSQTSLYTDNVGGGRWAEQY